jgi:hypothetical protein
MMQDRELANEILSTLLQKPVELLYQSATETQEVAKKQGGMHRLDYVCVIQDGGVPKKVLIELQRVEQVDDYKRFRRYLAFKMNMDSDIEFSKEDYEYHAKEAGYETNEEEIKHYEAIKKEHGVLEIITIYMLNFTVGIEAAMFESPNYFINTFTQKPTKQERKDSDFCRYLQHKMYVIQFPLMKKELEQLEKEGKSTSILRENLKQFMNFMATGAVSSEHYLMDYPEVGIEGLTEKVCSKLQLAFEKDKDIRFKLEDEKKSALEYAQSIQKGAKKLSDKMIKEAKEKAQLRVDKVLQREAKAQKEKEEAQQKLKNQNLEFAKMMLSLNLPIEQIIEKTNLTEAEILTLKSQS